MSTRIGIEIGGSKQQIVAGDLSGEVQNRGRSAVDSRLGHRLRR